MQGISKSAFLNLKKLNKMIKTNPKTIPLPANKKWKSSTESNFVLHFIRLSLELLSAQVHISLITSFTEHF